MWFSAQELTGLPGLPGTVQSINQKAKREGWQFRNRSGKGGGKEYHVSSLPTEAQARLLELENTPIYKEKTDELCGSALPGFDSVLCGADGDFVDSHCDFTSRLLTEAPKDKKTRQAEARQQILLTLQDYLTRQNAVGLGRVRYCRQAFVDAYNDPLAPKGELRLPWWVYGEVKSISYQTLYSWELKRDVAGVSGLARKQGKRTTTIEATPELKQACLDLLLAHPDISVVGMWHEMCERFEDCPSLPTLRRFVRGWKAENSDIFDFADSRKGWRNRHMKAFGSYRATRFNQRWEIDSTLADIVWELDDGFGGFQRYALVVAVEVYSRMARVLVCRTSNSLAIAAILRECLIDWGVPESVKTDNGKDYLSRHILNILSVLGIEHKKCVPFNPQQKPYVERFNHTLNHGAAMVLHPRYLGHDVVTRQKIRSRELWPEKAKRKGDESEIEVVRINKSLRQMQCFIEEWLIDYHNTPHEGLGQIRDGAGNLRHLTPYEAAANQPAKRIENVRALDVLMMPAPQGGYRATAGKKGIRVGNLPDGTPAYYWHECLVEVGRRFERVFVKLDPNPALIHLFDSEDCTEYLGVCECYEISGNDPMPGIIATRRAEKESRKLVAAARLSRRRLEKTELTPGREVALLKGQGEIHETPALKAAANLQPARNTTVIGIGPIKESAPLPLPNPGAPRLEREVVIPRVLNQWYAGEPVDPVELAFVGRQFELNRGGVTLVECLVRDREDFFKFRRWVLAQLSEGIQQTG
ncbi:DNA-binding protein [Synechococcus sp. PCC 6312]|uniref:DNA-binding protein n=1 Tax=Synechococcus sp. (strain ATCC 27167 / PCC 6312) TaxID=195253 RepID=UPI00029F1006|nr:DNA-binding protein [Synechococcus sp. PCC 6312]AFY60324.1 transposase, IS30 family [Synechococcus sp. PCC 6312]